ncbi:MAG: hydroxyisourate hydrolase [Candidatus Protistobacter heckmanni]|nr:hydroxyisourate hydrolase [Candidatus Protistobacter heckmanni]
MSGLTTHVLDTANGRPAQGMKLWLYRLEGDQKTLLFEGETNSDGRCDRPLLDGNSLKPGFYELDFSVDEYFTKLGQKLPEPSFLTRVTLRFGVANPQQHYHVPLLVSPWAYSTYRGS